MSFLLAAALSGAGVSGSADICRVDAPSFARTVYRYDLTSSGGGYIPPFADTPEAHAQTRIASRIVGGARGIYTSDTSALVRYLYVKSQLCEYDIRLLRSPVGQPLDSPTT